MEGKTVNKSNQSAKGKKLTSLILELKEKLNLIEQDFVAILLECTRYRNLDNIEPAGLEKVYDHLCVLDHINDLPSRESKHILCY